MKQYKYLYQKLLDEHTIRQAYKKLRKGKTKRKEIQYIDAHLDEEVKGMRTMIEHTKEGDELGFTPKQHEPRYIKEHGKTRKIYMPEIHEQWLHHIIMIVLEPIILKSSHLWSCGSIPKRGAHYGAKQMKRWCRKGFRNFAKLDIRHFYNHIRIDILMGFLRERIKDEWFLYVVGRCLMWFKKGIPLGFYISQWFANYLLEPLDRFVTGELHIKIYMRYVDDLFLAGTKKELHKAITEIKRFLGKMRLKLKRTYFVCRFDYQGKGRPVDFMGFLFYRDKTLIRKHIMINAVRMAKRIKKNHYIRHIRGFISLMGWFDYSNTYHCYEERIKPLVKVGTLKRKISRADKKEAINERLERRTLPCAA